MNDREREIVARYIKTSADALGLPQWTFLLKANPPDDDDTRAMISPIEGRWRADVRLCEGFKGYTPEQQRHYIVHELLHCHFTQAADVIRLDLYRTRSLSQNDYAQVQETYHRLMEYGVDALAEAVAMFLPFIAWETEESG